LPEDRLANSKSAEKRIRQAEKRQARNRAQRSRLKTAIKRVLSATEPEAATEAYRETAGMLDRMATRSLIHRNKAARKKSQLARKVLEVGGQA
jgi:small subunit ribosomal protein S20